MSLLFPLVFLRFSFDVLYVHLCICVDFTCITYALTFKLQTSLILAPVCNYHLKLPLYDMWKGKKRQKNRKKVKAISYLVKRVVSWKNIPATINVN